MSDLLSCPFCGGEPELIECDVPPYEGGDVVQCKRCQASSRVTFSCGEDGKPKVIAAWNKRVAPEEESAEIQKLNHIIEIQKRAIDRWVPCPDCRDKVNVGDGCLACRLQAVRNRMLRAEQRVADMTRALEAAYADHATTSKNSYETWTGSEWLWNDEVWREADPEGFELAQLMRTALASSDSK